MLANLFGSYWSIGSNYLPALNAMINHAITAGPVDDAQRYGLPVSKHGSTAIVKTRGPIVKQAGWLSYYGFAGTRESVAALKAADADPEIDSILWVMDTPGGSVDGLAEAAASIKTLSKPVTVFADGLLASAGYYLAANASAIIAAPQSLIGSIGVRTVMIDSSEYYKSMGVKVIPVDTGEFKSAGLPGTEVTDNHIADTQRIIDGYMDGFKSVVLSGRKMSEKSFNSISKGNVFFAEESIGLGLVDAVSTMEDVLNSYNETDKKAQARRVRHAKLRLLNLQ